MVELRHGGRLQRGDLANRTSQTEWISGGCEEEKKSWSRRMADGIAEVEAGKTRWREAEGETGKAERKGTADVDNGKSLDMHSSPDHLQYRQLPNSTITASPTINVSY